MVIQVNQELCLDCGACVDACSIGAIQMTGQRAVIVQELCTRCEACVEACPNGAIAVISEPAYQAPIPAHRADKTGLVPDQKPPALAEKAPSAGGLAPLAGAALVFLGQEVAPRLVDVLIDALDRKLARPTTTAIAPQFKSARGKGERQRTRCRRGQGGGRDHKERK
jgi:NAD-dependent dihydropyrimidine dehydrogenase PreA subunit